MKNRFYLKTRESKSERLSPYNAYKVYKGGNGLWYFEDDGGYCDGYKTMSEMEDAVFYYCDNPDFTKFITQEFYHEEYGSYSDIVDVAPALGVAAVNLSCGYYKAHTTEEYVVWEEMLASINQAKKIITQDVQEPFEYIEAERIFDDYWGSDWGNYWGSYGSLYNKYEETYQTFYIVYYENGNQTMSEVEATNKDAALLDFLMWHDSVPYKDIIEIFSESELNSY